MSATMEVAPVRVKLFFNNLPLESSWVLVKTKKYPKVKEFISYIKKKFVPKENGSLTIFINGSRVPEWEKSSILREDDTVQVYYKEPEHTSDRLTTTEQDDQSNTTERELRKKKKKKKKEKSTLEQCEDTERSHEEMDTCKSDDDHHRASKKRKMSTENHAIAVCDAELESVKNSDQKVDTVSTRKRKRTRKRKNRQEKAETPVISSAKPVHVGPLKQHADISGNQHIKFTSDNEEEASSTTFDVSGSQPDFVRPQDLQTQRTSTPVYHKNQTPEIPYSDSPTTVKTPALSQSVLANGVTVFSRPRSRQIKSSNFRELTKEEQLSTRLTNRSLVLQNTSQTNGQGDGPDPPEMDSPESSQVKEAPVFAIPVRREYQKFPLLQGNPSPGDTIAFKVLEMSENYTPEVGDYREANVISFNSSSQIVELNIIPGFSRAKRAGKFDVDDEDEETEKNAEENKIEAHPLTSMMEVRLITN